MFAKSVIRNVLFRRGSLTVIEPSIQVELINPANCNLTYSVNAILDSGATRSAITPAALQALQLNPTNNTYSLSTASATGQMVNSYILDIKVPTIAQSVLITGNETTATLVSSGAYDMLIGTDVLGVGNFHLYKDGTFHWDLN